ncbi:UNKNOWN [Stylonychia lemnae]|uniref:DUSP domain-containing protein n=1 Tax=Stylonychia lemnae TaxID=5949 RepID=A0A078AXJ3_STYLE|nr:UNKNOWN [Stylonychia lemnae]|eukprot:CDW85513.1 UNKNOWN [Stylonychia lemnae]
MLNHHQLNIQCPFCLQDYQFSSINDAKIKIAKNYTLLSILDQDSGLGNLYGNQSRANQSERVPNYLQNNSRFEELSKQQSHQQFSPYNDEQVYQNNENNNINYNSNNSENAKVFIHVKDSKKVCPQHNQARIYYEFDHNKKLRLYCNKCDVAAQKKSNLKILPQVIHEFSSNLRKFYSHSLKCDTITKKVIENIPEYIEQGKARLKKQLNSHLKNIKKALKIYKEMLENKLEEVWTQAIDKKLDVIERISDSKTIINNQLEILKEREIQLDGGAIRFQDFELFDDLQEWVNNIQGFKLHPELLSTFFLELKDQQVLENSISRILLDENSIEFQQKDLSNFNSKKIINNLNASREEKEESIDLRIDNIDYINGEIETEIKWTCIKCSSVNSQEQFKVLLCQDCKQLRDFYTNQLGDILIEKSEALSNAIDFMKFYQREMFDELGQLKSDQDIMICKSWMNKWQVFVSSDEQVPPSYIDNLPLLNSNQEPQQQNEKNKNSVKKSLSEIINHYQWDFLNLLYGGGPIIPTQDCIQKLQSNLFQDSDNYSNDKDWIDYQNTQINVNEDEFEEQKHQFEDDEDQEFYIKSHLLNESSSRNNLNNRSVLSSQPDLYTDMDFTARPLVVPEIKVKNNENNAKQGNINTGISVQRNMQIKKIDQTIKQLFGVNRQASQYVNNQSASKQYINNRDRSADIIQSHYDIMKNQSVLQSQSQSQFPNNFQKPIILQDPQTHYIKKQSDSRSRRNLFEQKLSKRASNAHHLNYNDRNDHDQQTNSKSSYNIPIVIHRNEKNEASLNDRHQQLTQSQLKPKQQQQSLFQSFQETNKQHQNVLLRSNTSLQQSSFQLFLNNISNIGDIFHKGANQQ